MADEPKVSISVDFSAEEAITKAEQLRAEIERIFEETSGEKVSQEFEEIKDRLEQSYIEAGELINQLNSISEVKVPTKEYADLQKALSYFYDEQKRLLDVQKQIEDAYGSHPPSYLASQWNTADLELDKLGITIDKTEDKLTELENKGLAFDTSDLKKVTNDLGEVNNDMSTALKEVEQLNETPISTSKWETLRSAVGTALGAAGNKIKSFISAVGEIGSAIAPVVKKAADALKNKLVSAIKTAINAVKQLASNIKTIASNAITSGVKKLSTAIFGIGKSSKSSNMDMKKALRTLIKYTFGVRSFYFLYRRIRKAITEGFGDLAKYSGDLNGKVSQVSTSLLYLRNAITTAFAPIVNFVAPAISQLLNLLAQAATSVGQFFAALFGATSFVRAKKVYKDYAQDLQKSEATQQAKQEEARKKFEEREDARYEKYLKQKAKKEKKWQEKQLKQRQKYERQLAGFDDVEILKEAEKEDKMEEMDPFERKQYEAPLSSQDLMKPWEDFNNMFETVRIDEKFKALADKIKGFFKNKDWEGLGKFLADGINKAFSLADSLITSQSLLNKINTIVDAIVGTLNSLVRNVDWALIGKTIGDLINLIIYTMNRLLTEIDWFAIGASIATGLNSLISTVNWDAIGQFFSNKLNAIVGLFYGFVHNFHWAELGKAFGDAVNGFFLNINWTDIANSLAEAINGVFTTLYNIAHTIRWEEIATNLTNAFILFINNVRWEDIRIALGELFRGVLRFINTVLDLFPFAEMGAKLGKGINSIFLNTDWNSAATTFAKSVNKVFDFLYNLATTINWHDIAIKLTNALNTFVEQTDWVKIGKTLEKLFMGVLDFLLTAVQNFNWIRFGEHIGDMLLQIDWLSLLDKVFSFIAELIVGLGETLFMAIYKVLVSITNKTTDWLKNKSAKEIIEGLLKGLIMYWANIGKWVVDHIFMPFWKAICRAWEIASPSKKMMQIGKYIVQGIFNGITDMLKNISNWVKTNIFDKFMNAVKTAFGIAGSVANKLLDIGKSIINGIKNGISNAWQSLSSYVSKIPSAIYKLLNVGKWADIGDNIIDGIERGIRNGWRWLTNTVQDLAWDLLDAAKRALGINSPSKLFRDIVGKAIPAGVGVGIDANASEAIDSVDELSNKLAKAGASQIKLPPIAAGQIIPYSIGKADTAQTNDTLNKVLDMLEYNQNRGITMSELESSLEELFRRFLNITFYLSDEQVARHANAGNARLDRRFNPSIT